MEDLYFGGYKKNRTMVDHTRNRMGIRERWSCIYPWIGIDCIDKVNINRERPVLDIAVTYDN